MIQAVHDAPEDSYQNFYTEHFSAVVHYLRGKGMGEADAEDLAQEIFVYAYRSWDKYDPTRASRKTWLYLMVRSRWINYLRDRKTFMDIDDFSGVIPDGTDMDQSIWVEEVRNAVADALNVLAENQKKAVVLRYFGNATEWDIANALGTTPGNARVLVHRGLKRLEKELSEKFGGLNGGINGGINA